MSRTDNPMGRASRSWSLIRSRPVLVHLGHPIRGRAVQTLAVNGAVVHISGSVRQGFSGLRGDEPAVRLVSPETVVAGTEEVPPAGRVREQLVVVDRVEISHQVLATSLPR